MQLALRLLRPLLLLAAMAVYRCLYCLGTLHRQLQHEAMPPAAHAAKRWATGWLLAVLHKCARQVTQMKQSGAAGGLNVT